MHPDALMMGLKRVYQRYCSWHGGMNKEAMDEVREGGGARGVRPQLRITRCLAFMPHRSLSDDGELPFAKVGRLGPGRSSALSLSLYPNQLSAQERHQRGRFGSCLVGGTRQFSPVAGPGGSQGGGEPGMASCVQAVWGCVTVPRASMSSLEMRPTSASSCWAAGACIGDLDVRCL